MLLTPYFNDADQPSDDGEWPIAKPGWYIGIGSKFIMDHGAGWFSTRIEVERAIQSLIDAGVETYDQLTGLSPERFRELIYRDLLW